MGLWGVGVGDFGFPVWCLGVSDNRSRVGVRDEVRCAIRGYRSRVAVRDLGLGLCLGMCGGGAWGFGFPVVPRAVSDYRIRVGVIGIGLEARGERVCIACLGLAEPCALVCAHLLCPRPPGSAA